VSRLSLKIANGAVAKLPLFDDEFEHKLQLRYTRSGLSSIVYFVSILLTKQNKNI
jgi:hypothetical protein